MEIETQEHVVRTMVVRPTGRIDAFTVQALNDKFNALLDVPHNNFVVDLATVSFLDSAGIAALVSLLKASRQAEGDVKLVWPEKPEAQRILKLTKFDRVFEMFDSAELALGA